MLSVNGEQCAACISRHAVFSLRLMYLPVSALMQEYVSLPVVLHHQWMFLYVLF